MAVSVKNIKDDLGDKFQLRLIAGEAGLDAIVTWVHMLEDTSVVDFFWGNEIIVTSGYVAHEEEDMMHLFEILNEKRCAAVVINIGKYIQAIPQTIIDYCEANVIPLFTMPWQMSMVEFVRSSCTALTQSVRSEEDLEKAVMNAVNAPQNPGGYYSELSSYFTEENGFTMIAVRVHGHHKVKTQEMIQDHRTLLRLHTALRGISVPYLILRKTDSKRVFLLLNSTDELLAKDCGEKIRERILERIPNVTVCVGIGEPIHRFETLPDAYHSALSAQRCADLQMQDLINFSQMGFYRLLYSVPNEELLRSYYYDTVGCLLDYDKEHEGRLTETLFRYLLTNGSLTEVASQMFTHRNTINYRMGKVREITGCNFSTATDRMPYLLAYHIGTILKMPFDGTHYIIPLND